MIDIIEWILKQTPIMSIYISVINNKSNGEGKQYNVIILNKVVLKTKNWIHLV